MNKQQAINLSKELSRYIKGLDLNEISEHDVAVDIFNYIHDLGYITGGEKNVKKNNQNS